MMTIQETVAHALINEHCRDLFLNKASSTHSVYGFRTRFWRLLMLAYDERLFELPHQLGLDPPAPGRAVPFNYPAFTLSQTMRLGIAPTKAMLYPIMGGFDHQYTPIHIATAMLRHGAAVNHEEAHQLLTVSFMKKAYPTRSASQFAAHAFINPYRPEDLGLKPFDAELLFTPDRSPIILDELGNAAWFPVSYIERILAVTENAHWYSPLVKLNGVHGLWHPLVHRASSKLLHGKRESANHEYRNTTTYLRNASPTTAREWLSKVDGVRRILNVVRRDATPKEMALGLSTIIANQNPRTEEMFRYIGRELTVEDFAAMKPAAALRALYFAPYDAVAQAIKDSSIDIGSMFFALTDPNTLPLVTSCMSQHGSREKKWFPDTVEGKHDLSMQTDTSPEKLKETWTNAFKPFIDDYDRAKEWRDELVQLASPDVLFLALLRGAAPLPEDPIPTIVVDNALRSVSNITEIQNVIKTMPSAIKSLSAL